MLERITHNWSLKLLALAIAVSMWVFVAGQETSEITVEVAVELTNIPAHMAVVEDVVSRIQVRLSGPSSLIRRLATRNLVKVVDLSGMGLGQHVFRLSPRDLQLPAGVQVVRVSPASFTVTLARKIKRQVPVSGVLKGQPAPGYEVSDVLFNPPQVEISGTEKDMEAVDWIWTVPIDVTGLKKDTKFKVGLRMPRGESLKLGQNQVEALVKIKLRGVDRGKPAHPAGENPMSQPPLSGP